MTPDHLPIAAAEVDLLADVRPRDSAAAIGFADHHFALALFEPSAADDVDVGAHLDARRGQSAHRHVGAFLVIAAAQVDDGDHFERGQRLAVAARRRCRT